MTLADIIIHFRELADDTVSDSYQWSTSIVTKYAVLAEAEACSRRPLLTSSTNTTICSIAITDASAIYAKHITVRQVYKAELISTADATDIIDLYITNVDELHTIEPDWRSLDGPPQYLILDDSNVELVPPPEEDGTLWLNVSHIPLVDMDDTGVAYDAGPPEVVEVLAAPTIDVAHHFMLIFYMLYLAYTRNDADTEDKARSLDYEAIFTAYFGSRPDALATKSIRQVRSDRQPSGWI